MYTIKYKYSYSTVFIFTVARCYIAPRYIATLASCHEIVKNGFFHTNHPNGPQGNGEQDNGCLFWHFYLGTTLCNWNQCFSTPLVDGDKQGWHYNGGKH